MECLHGIRVISTQWVVLAHTYAVLIALPSQNPIYYVEVMLFIVQFNNIFNPRFDLFFQFAAQYINMVIVSARISVDTFLVISGLLASYTLLKHLEKTYAKNSLKIIAFEIKKRR